MRLVATVYKHNWVIIVKDTLPRTDVSKQGDCRFNHTLTYNALCIVTRSPAVAEGPRDAGVPVEIL